MAKKRMTKQQREAQQIAALTQRLTDIYAGAAGGSWDEEQEWPTPTNLAHICPTVFHTFNHDDLPSFIWDTRNLDKWEEPSKLAAFLYEYGVRT